MLILEKKMQKYLSHRNEFVNDRCVRIKRQYSP
jgi:hypothetical protein